MPNTMLPEGMVLDEVPTAGVQEGMTLDAEPAIYTGPAGPRRGAASGSWRGWERLPMDQVAALPRVPEQPAKTDRNVVATAGQVALGEPSAGRGAGDRFGSELRAPPGEIVEAARDRAREVARAGEAIGADRGVGARIYQGIVASPGGQLANLVLGGRQEYELQREALRYGMVPQDEGFSIARAVGSALGMAPALAIPGPAALTLPATTAAGQAADVVTGAGEADWRPVAESAVLGAMLQWAPLPKALTVPAGTVAQRLAQVGAREAVRAGEVQLLSAATGQPVTPEGALETWLTFMMMNAPELARTGRAGRFEEKLRAAGVKDPAEAARLANAAVYSKTPEAQTEARKRIEELAKDPELAGAWNETVRLRAEIAEREAAQDARLKDLIRRAKAGDAEAKAILGAERGVAPEAAERGGAPVEAEARRQPGLVPAVAGAGPVEQALRMTPGRYVFRDGVYQPAEPAAATTIVDGRLAPVEVPTYEVPIDTIRVQDQVKQFKRGADPETGVVRGMGLEGKYERRGTAPIVLWERLDGVREVITGRNRLDLARRTGEKTIPAQVVREADGVTREVAERFDAEANIRDGQGEVSDYAAYFRSNQELSEAGARELGLISRAKGQAGWALGRSASDDLYSLYQAGRIGEDKAVAIAAGAPRQAALQSAGIEFARNPGATAADVGNFLATLQEQVRQRQAAGMQGDLFGFDDAALNAAKDLARAASKKQREIAGRLQVLRAGRKVAGAKFRDIAAEYGINVDDPAALDQATAAAEADLEAWRSWATDPAKVAELRGEKAEAQATSIAQPAPGTITGPDAQLGAEMPARAEATLPKPLELMTPDEWAQQEIARKESEIAELSASARRIPGNLTRRKDRTADKIAKSEGEKYARIQRLREMIDELRAGQGTAMREYAESLKAAIKESRPVSAVAMDKYGVTLPARYVRDGDRFVVRTEPRAEADRAGQQQLIPSAEGGFRLEAPAETTDGARVVAERAAAERAKAEAEARQGSLVLGRPMAEPTAEPGMMEKPKLGGTDDRPPGATPPPADDPQHTILPLELPEIIEFAVQLAGGSKYPRVLEQLRLLNGQAAGAFYGDPLDTRIELARSIFKILQPSDLRAAKAEAVAWVEREFPKAPEEPAGDAAMITDDMLPDGRLRSQAVTEKQNAILDELAARRLKENPAYASAVAAHEIMHWIDYLPQQMVQGRGNIFGHIAALKRYLLEMLAVKPQDQDKLLTAKERQELRKKAAAQVGAKPPKDEPEALAEWQTAVSEQYQELLDLAAEGRGLVRKKWLLEELEPLIAWWNGTEEMPPYYSAPEEMYAEAGSILVNNPAAVRARAPTFWKMWQNWLTERPDVKRRWEQFQTDIMLGRVQDERDRRQVEAFDRANKQHEAILAAEAKLSAGEQVDALLMTVWRGSFPFTRRAKRAGVDVRSRGLKALQDYNYRMAYAMGYAQETANTVGQQVFVDNAIPAAEWDTFLQNKHIVENRFVIDEQGRRQPIASMLGMNPAASQKSLDAQRVRMGEARFQVMEQALARWHALRMTHVAEALRASGFASPELLQTIEERSAYTRVAAVDLDVDPMAAMFAKRYGGEVGARIYGQKGYLGAARSPWLATLEQDVKLIAAAKRNDLIRQMGKVLAEIGDPLYAPAGTRWDAGLKRQVPVIGEDAHRKTLVYLEDGKPVSYWAPKALAEFMETADPLSASVIRRWLQVGVRDLKLIYTAWNYGFPIFNYPRDRQDWIRKLPGWKTNWLGRYSYRTYKEPARAAARSILEGRPNAVALQALTRGMVNAYARYDEPKVEKPGAMRFANTWEIRPETLGVEMTKAQRLAVAAKRTYLAPGAVRELEVKIAGMLYMDDRYPTEYTEQEKQRAVQMLAGSPDFASRATGNSMMDVFIPFINPAQRGAESEWEAFRMDPWHYIIESFRLGVVPKLIMYGLGAGLFNQAVDRMMGAGKGEDIQKQMERIPDYYKANYTVVPLGWDPTDQTRTKVVFLSIPRSEGNRFAGGLVWQIMNGGDFGEVFNFGADQMPGLNPLGVLAWNWGEVLSGRAPTGVGITQTQVDAGAATIPMLKYTSNQLFGGLLTRFPREAIGDTALSRLERALRLPVVANTIGRVLRVSNKGFADAMRRAARPIEDAKAEQRNQAYTDAMTVKKAGGRFPPEIEYRLRSGASARTMAGSEDGIWSMPTELALQAYYYQQYIQYQREAMESSAPDYRALRQLSVPGRQAAMGLR